ncbi:hypothetical protein CVT26_005795 [Gymnopilus dilepis]|uniref:Novel STAND NTPase 1 domain-containing protein n=1 Tax=Gymnopilus dilepis TaxID=231916 RepID=A0A409YL38_9AGAR|nr:hypothetical protein CVT26_005795 [Gymnopilus dilepis]
MSAGCFSWCPIPRPRHAKPKSSTNSSKSDASTSGHVQKLPEKLSNSANSKIPNEKAKAIDIAPESSTSTKSRSAAPTTAQYVTASGKEVLTILESAAGVIPVPLLQEAIGVALKIIEVLEEGSAVEQKVKELQDRVGHLMIVVVDNVTKEEEEANAKAKLLERDIAGLLSTLGTIQEDLTEISEQNRWVITFYKDLNTSTLEACMSRLATALEKFKLANDLRDSDLLQELHNRLGKMSSQVNNVSRDMQHVVDKVDNIDTKLDEFHVLLAKSKQSATSAIVRQQMPLKPEVFYGRDALVSEIATLLVSEETSQVCILGPGGMGKTSVSLAVVESPLVQKRFSRSKSIWIPCIGATSAALLIETLYVQLQIPGEKQPSLEKIISELSHSEDPRLLVLDNFETPWNAPGDTQKQVGDILRQLAQLKHIALLVTMRGSRPPCDKAIKWQSKNIQPTDEEACLHIFYEINPDAKDDPDVGRLLRSLGYMPFAVTLMANLGKEAYLTAKELLDAWLECGPDMFSDNPEQSIARSISLSVDSDLVKQNPNSLLLLSVLSLLPGGTTRENLSWWAPTLKKALIPAAIATLSKAALLVQNEQQGSNAPILFVIPVVQSFMQHQGRIPEDLRKEVHASCCQYVLQHARRYDLSGFMAESKLIAAEDTNIHAVLFDTHMTSVASLTDTTMEAILAFCWHRCDTKPSLEIVEHALTVARTYGVKRYIALAMWCLGKTCHQVAKFRLAYEHLQQAYELFNSLPADRKLQEYACQCGNDFVDASRNVLPREEVVSLARKVEEKCATLGNDLIHGRSLMYLAFALQEADRRQEALPFAEQARAMLAGVGNLCHLSNTYQLIARIHYYDKKLPDALDMITQASQLAARSGSPFFEGFVAVEFGMILFTLDRDGEAWKQIELALMKASNYGDEHCVVLALDYMGYGYLRRGDYRNALEAYEAASGKWAGTNETKSEKFCQENISKIKEKLRTPEAVIGFHRPGFDNNDSLFYPLV